MNINSELIEKTDIQPRKDKVNIQSKKLTLSISREYFNETVFRQKTLSKHIEDISKIGRICKDDALLVDEFTNGGLFKKISLEEFSNIPTQTNSAYTVTFVKDFIRNETDMIKDKIVKQIEDLNAFTSSLKDAETITNILLDLFAGIESHIVVINKFKVKPIVLFDDQLKEESALTTDIKELTLPFNQQLNEFVLGSCGLGFKYSGIYRYLSDLLGKNLGSTLTLSDLFAVLEDVSLQAKISNIPELLDVKIKVIESFKDELTTVEQENLGLLISTKGEALISNIEDVYDIDMLINDVIKFITIYKETIKELNTLA